MRSAALEDAERALRAGDLQACLDALRPGPTTARGLYLSGVARLRQGDLEGATADLERSLLQAEDGAARLALAHARRYAGDLTAAADHLARARELAVTRKDGALMVGALCGQGDVALARGEGQAAALLFGRARGLAELAGSEALSVWPLAGLAEAQAAWGYPAKAARTAEKALERARAAQDGVGEVRALAAFGCATRQLEALKEAERRARALPHHPLAAHIRALLGRLEIQP